MERYYKDISAEEFNYYFEVVSVGRICYNSNYLYFHILMQQTSLPTGRSEWIKILNKGVITLPKKLRDQAGIQPGDVARARVSGKSIIIESRDAVDTLRTFTEEDIARWEKEDRLPPELLEKYKDWLDEIV